MTSADTSARRLHYEAIIPPELFGRMLRHVHVVYWPILFLNLWYVKRWARAAEVKGNGYVAVRFSKHGVIQLKWNGAIFLEDGPADIDPLAALPSWQSLQTRLLPNIFAALSVHPRTGGDLWTMLRRHIYSDAHALAGGVGAWGTNGKKLEPG